MLAELSSPGDAQERDTRLCEVAAEVSAVTGAGITLIAGDGTTTSLCTSDEVSALLQELQFTLGEGPSIDAHNQHRPVLEPDLTHPTIVRWVGLTPPAVTAGVRGIFGFPIQVGTVRLGALSLHSDQPGPLSDDQHAYALTVADVAAHAVLAMQANAPPGAMAAELAAGSDFQAVVHQAAGMISFQLGVTVGEALVRLRAHAYARNQLVAVAAGEVVRRELSFDDSRPDESGH